MKKIVFGLIASTIVFLLSMSVQAQNQSQEQVQNPIDVRQTMVYRMQRGIYQRAMKYNDLNAAISALYNICILEPQNDSILFGLAYIYFDNQKYLSATLTLNDVVLLNPDNLQALELKALSLENIGALDKSLEDYESLYLKSNNINFLYKMAIFQYELSRFKEARTNLDILLSKKEADELRVYYPGENDQQQEILMRASLHNLKGLIAKEEGNITEAKKQMGIALEVEPDFYQARKNLSELSEQ
jgi:tetratricopeptide (TPR) repeat protein